MKVISEKTLENMLCYIKTYQIENGQSPSYRNIMKHLGLSSLSVTGRYVEELASRGHLSKDERGSIEISNEFNVKKTTIAPVVGTVTCGSPILAQENIESVCSLPCEIFGSGELFMLHAEGDSMEGVGIKSGDLLVVKKSSSAQNGQIVVALMDDSATVKTFYQKKDHIVLHPENEKYDDIISRDVKILGVVEHFIHKL